MKKKLLVTAIASAMVAPASFAAQDTSGMQYTSASEGFYASIRVRYKSSTGTEGGGSDFQNAASRIGVRGSNDLGGGLEGFYQYEIGVGTNNGDSLSTRIGRVGLRGGFGQVQVGSFWNQSYNWVHGTTDIANTHSGNLNYNDLYPGRETTAIEYTTPDLNGFQGAILVQMDPGKDGEGDINSGVSYQIGDVNGRLVGGHVTAIIDGVIYNHGQDYSDDAETNPIDLTGADGSTVKIGDTVYTIKVTEGPVLDANGDPTDAMEEKTRALTTAGNPNDDNDVDKYILAAKYDVQGLSAAVHYTVIPDALGAGTDDRTGYAVKLGYAQDNWYVNGWYGQDNASDEADVADDVARLSLGGGVAVGKVNVYALYESQDDGADEDAYSTFGVQYNLGSRSRVWVEYAGRDLDTVDDEEDFVTIGLRHDF